MKDILIEILSPNSLVIVESTVEPGFIEDEMVPIISKSGRLFVSSSFGNIYAKKFLDILNSNLGKW